MWRGSVLIVSDMILQRRWRAGGFGSTIARIKFALISLCSLSRRSSPSPTIPLRPCGLLGRTRSAHSVRICVAVIASRSGFVPTMNAVLALAIFTLGMTFFFAAANVYYRDVSHILQILLSAWFYLTPIIYPLDLIPARYQWIFKLNPMIYVINGFRLAVYYGMLPKAPSIVASFVCAFLSLFLGFAIFRKYQDNFVFYV